MSQDSICLPVEDILSQSELGHIRKSRPGQFSSAGSDYVCPPTSVGHNSFVRTPFRVFLNSMESPLSQDSRNVNVKGIRCAQLG